MRARALGIVSASLLLLWSGCNLNVDYFGDYRGKNILGNYGFSTGKWSLEPYSAYSAVPLYSTADYMTWAAASDLSGLGLDAGPDGTPAYRLEIKNLFQDGDFESQTNPSTSFTGDAWWSLSNSSVKFTSSSSLLPNISSGTSYSPLEHVSLFFRSATTADIPNNYLAIQLDSALGSTLWQRSGGYRFRFSFYNAGSTTTLDVHMVNQTASSTTNSEGSGTWTWNNLNASDTVDVYNLSRYFTLDGTATGATVYIGDWNGTGTGNGVDATAAVIDNVRVIQNDLPPYVITKLSGLSSGSLKLLSGSRSGAYSFSFYVHDDPTADQSRAVAPVHSPNRLNPSGVTVVFTAAVKSGSGTYKAFTARPATGWTSWTKITIPLGFDFVSSDSDIPSGSSALTIEMGPTNTYDSTTGGRDAGSLIISSPTLVFNP